MVIYNTIIPIKVEKYAVEASRVIKVKIVDDQKLNLKNYFVNILPISNILVNI